VVIEVIVIVDLAVREQAMRVLFVLLDAEVVDLIVVKVLGVQKGPGVDEGIAIYTRDAKTRQTHRDDVRTDIAQIKVEPVRGESHLISRHQSLDEIPRWSAGTLLCRCQLHFGFFRQFGDSLILICL
jgi:hypothetical protein